MVTTFSADQYNAIKKAGILLAEYRGLLTEGMTEPQRRNAANTFHDFVKITLKALTSAKEAEFLGQVDLGKRFAFVRIRFPFLDSFEHLVLDCKRERDKVAHHDTYAPAVETLRGWLTDGGELLRVATDALISDVDRLERLLSIADTTGGLWVASLTWESPRTGKFASRHKMLDFGEGDIYHTTNWLAIRNDFGPHQDFLFPSHAEAVRFQGLVAEWDHKENCYYVIDADGRVQCDSGGSGLIAWRPHVHLSAISPFEAVERFS